MWLENERIFEIKNTKINVWKEIELVLSSLNKLSNQVNNGLNSDYRGLAKLTESKELNLIGSSSNPTASVVEAWLRKSSNATLLDLLGFIEKIGRMDIYRKINCIIDNYKQQGRQIISLGTHTQERGKRTSAFDEENMITLGDVDMTKSENSYMLFDAFILYTDDPIDIGFAFEIKKVMEEKFYYMMCTREDLLLGLPFEHDAIMRLLDQKRCDKLIVIISDKFCEQCEKTEDGVGLIRFILKFAQALQIYEKKKIIPCARDNHGISYNLKGYSVLSQARSGKLFNFWERLSFILEDGRVSVDRRLAQVVVSQTVNSDPKRQKESEKNNNFSMRVRKICTNFKTKVLVKEK